MAWVTSGGWAPLDLGVHGDEGLAVVALEHRILEADRQHAGLGQRDAAPVLGLEIEVGQARRRRRGRSRRRQAAQDQLDIADILADLGRGQAGQLVLQLLGQFARGQTDQTQTVRIEREPRPPAPARPIPDGHPACWDGRRPWSRTWSAIARSVSGSGPTTRKLTGQITGGP